VQQEWTIGDARLTVSKWLAPAGFAVRVWGGWPPQLESKASLDPAAVYAIVKADRIVVLGGSFRAKAKLRLLLDAGVIKPVLMPPLPGLPDGTRATAQEVWRAVGSLLQVERLCGCHPQGDPVMITPAFIANWAGITDDQAKDGIRRLRSLKYLVYFDKQPTRAEGHSANRYLIRGDSEAVN
jgi:hypothetical protein